MNISAGTTVKDGKIRERSDFKQNIDIRDTLVKKGDQDIDL